MAGRHQQEISMISLANGPWSWEGPGFFCINLWQTRCDWVSSKWGTRCQGGLQSWAKGGKSCLLLVFYTDSYIDSKYYSRHGQNITGFNDAGTFILTEAASFCALIRRGWDQRKLNSYGQLSQTVAVFCPSTSGCGRARSDGGDHGMPKGCPGAAAWGTHSGDQVNENNCLTHEAHERTMSALHEGLLQ